MVFAGWIDGSNLNTIIISLGNKKMRESDFELEDLHGLSNSTFQSDNDGG